MKPDKPKLPPPPPPPPTMADPSIEGAAREASAGYSSLISTSPQGLVRKANTTKRSLIGGS